MRKLIFTWCWLVLLLATGTQAFALQAAGPETKPAEPKTEPSEAQNFYELELASLDRQLAAQAQLIERSRKELHDLKVPELERTLQGQIEALRDKLNTKQVVADPAFLTQLMSRRVDLMIDLAGLTARQEAALQENPQIKAKKDFLDEQLQFQTMALEASEQKSRVLAKLAETGHASEVDTQDMNQRLILQKMKLLEIKHQRDSIGLENSAISETALQIAEKRAQLKMVAELLDEAARTRPIQIELESLQSRLERLRTTREMGISDAMRRAEAAFHELKHDRAKIEILLHGQDNQEHQHDDH
ncbi:MAG: hypothetical protein KF851_11540 [Pirellulaceae bacterium]|nr:hypothetical protein [Pirellulaceae bacterium]